jgi:CheY-like chemotaxis protein
MDIQMPVMNGYDATREIRKFRPILPIVALTAYAFREDRIRSLDAGCNDMLTKPVVRRDLLTMIKKVLG